LENPFAIKTPVVIHFFLANFEDPAGYFQIFALSYTNNNLWSLGDYFTEIPIKIFSVQEQLPFSLPQSRSAELPQPNQFRLYYYSGDRKKSLILFLQ
jgi:hypothetical protein